MAIQVLTTNIGKALSIIDAAWAEVNKGFYSKMASGEPIDRLPQISLDEARKRTMKGKKILAKIKALDAGALPHDIVMPLCVAKAYAGRWSKEADWYPLVYDIMGMGFPGMFMCTAYSTGFFLNFIGRVFSEHRFDHSGDGDRYLALVSDYIRFVGQMHGRTRFQAEQGIYMPQPQLTQAVPLLKG